MLSEILRGSHHVEVGMKTRIENQRSTCMDIGGSIRKLDNSVHLSSLYSGMILLSHQIGKRLGNGPLH